MKSSDIDIAYEYGVVPSWSYSSRDSRNPNTCTRNHVLQTRIVSLVKYQYGVWRTVDEFSPNFIKTDATKGFGYKVESNGTYWVARPQDVIARWDTLEARWAVQEAEQRAANEEAEKRRQRDEALRNDAITNAQDSKARITSNLRAILKRDAYVHVTTEMDRNGNWISNAHLDVKVLDSLVERVLDLVEV